MEHSIVPQPTELTTWTKEYDKYGGYDCMSSAYYVHRPGLPSITLDRRDYASDEAIVADADLLIAEHDTAERVRLGWV